MVALALLVGACSNESSTGTSTTTPGGSDTDGATAGIFPAELVNAPVHEGTPERGGTLTWGLESDVLDVSPNQRPIQPADVQLASAVYAPLVTWGSHGEFAGMAVTDNTDLTHNQLAESIVSPDDDLIHWTLTLRDDAVFANGEPVTAAQVVEATEWAKASLNCSCAQNAEAIESVTAVDERTVDYVLNTPMVDWPTKLTSGGLAWITESGARDAAPDPSNPTIEHLVGAGPFAFESHSGDTYTVVANEHYFGIDVANDDAPLPYLDKIVFRPLADSTTRLQAVQSDSVQIIQTADTSNLVQAKEDPDLQVQPAEGSSATITVLNLTHPPFGVEPEPGESAQQTAIRSLDDETALAARRAVNLSINRNEINQKYYKGTRVPAYGFFPPSSPWFHPEGQVPRHDAAKAAELVDQVEAAGVEMYVHSICINTPESQGVSEIIGEQGRAVGIDGKLQQVEQAVLVNTMLSGGTGIEWDRACFRSPQLADPDGIYGAVVTGGPGNLVKYSRPQVDEWLDAARSTSDVDERKRLYDQIQEQFAADSAVIPLLFDYWGNVFRTEVSGLSAPALGSLGIIDPGGLYFKAA